MCAWSLTLCTSADEPAPTPPPRSPTPPALPADADAETTVPGPARAKRPREDDDDGADADERPATRARTEAYVPPPGGAPGFLGWLAAPVRAFMAGFRDALRGEADVAAPGQS
jgi:hypothetical protein